MSYSTDTIGEGYGWSYTGNMSAVDGKNESTTKISLKEMYELQQDRTAYDEYYRKQAYVPDDFPIHKLQEKNVKKWALCGVYSTDTIRQGYGNNSIKWLYIQNKNIMLYT